MLGFGRKNKNTSYILNKDHRSKIRILSVRRYPIKELHVLYDHGLGKIAKEMVYEFLKHSGIGTRLDIHFHEIDRDEHDYCWYYKRLKIQEIYSFVHRIVHSHPSRRIVYFTYLYPEGVNEPYVHASASYGDVAIISINGVCQYIRNAKFKDALIWLTLHEIGHIFGLSHHENCAMDPVHIHKKYCDRCVAYLRSMVE